MTNQRSKQIAQLTYLAGQMDDSRRTEFLNHACASDRDLRKQIDARLGSPAGVRKNRRHKIAAWLSAAFVLFTICCLLIGSDRVTANDRIANRSGKPMADEFSINLAPLANLIRAHHAPAALLIPLNTQPDDAEVMLDGVAVENCRTPCSVQVAPGHHVLTFLKPGYRDAIRQVDITTPGGLPVVELAPLGGTLFLQSEPSGATILIDGKEHEQKAPAHLTLAPGTYQITLRLGSAEDNFSLDVADGDIGHMSIPVR